MRDKGRREKSERCSSKGEGVEKRGGEGREKTQSMRKTRYSSLALKMEKGDSQDAEKVSWETADETRGSFLPTHGAQSTSCLNIPGKLTIPQSQQNGRQALTTL